jgi:glycosyltransferase involved in cell wall biosynthesis
LKKSSGFKKINVIEKINNGQKSLSETYNEILSEATTDVVILCHDDIYFDTSAWYHKIMKHFEKTEYGILGVAGTTDLSETGQWWVTNKRKNMVGIVNHEHEGKKWESKYSDSVNNSIIPTVIVDGLFIVINKKRIKRNFVEDFKGFHFYDLSFCLENFLEGVKVGVITNVRITHKSIGMTNQSWEDNRQLFVEKYSNQLPVKVSFDPSKKIKVLLSCLFFRTFTGSEVYVYELAKALQKQNCSVTVMSQIGGPLTEMAKKDGIKCISFEQAPGFKLGDGVWEFATPQGNQKSQQGIMYKVAEPNFDIIHIQHKPVVERILQFYPEVEKVTTIHSEIMSKELENPVIHPSIKKYIAIRPEIKNHIIENFEIPEDLIEVIYNPVDNQKFKVRQNKDDGYVLFVGTIDYLRESAIRDLIEYTKNNGKELWLVGANHSNYLDEILTNTNVKHFEPTWNLEKFLSNCLETAGIQLGRTTIEGWMSGKKSWIYNVDASGTILQKNLIDPPSDISKYYSENVAKQIRDVYLKVLS